MWFFSFSIGSELWPRAILTFWWPTTLTFDLDLWTLHNEDSTSNMYVKFQNNRIKTAVCRARSGLRTEPQTTWTLHVLSLCETKNVTIDWTHLGRPMYWSGYWSHYVVFCCLGGKHWTIKQKVLCIFYQASPIKLRDKIWCNNCQIYPCWQKTKQ